MNLHRKLKLIFLFSTLFVHFEIGCRQSYITVLKISFFLIYELNTVVSIHSNVFYPATSTLKMLHVHFSWARFFTICLLCKFFIYQCFPDKLLTFYDFPLLSSGKTRITKQKLEFLIRFFMFHHMFPLCLLTNKTSEKLANVFGSNQKHFCLIFLFCHQFFHYYRIFGLNRWQNKLNLQKQKKKKKTYKKLKNISCSLKNNIGKSRQDSKYKKRKLKNMVRKCE